MDISLKLGMFFFMYYLLTGLAMLVNPRFILQAIQDIFANRGLMLMVGFVALIMGLFIVSFHGYYEMQWPILLTIFGWLAVLKGFMYLIADNFIKNFANRYHSESAIRVFGLASLVIAGFLGCSIFY